MKTAALALAIALSVTACSSVSSPEKKLLGKWQAEVPATKRPHQLTEPLTGIQFEFFADGSCVKNTKWGDGNWKQTSTGTFKFADSSHVKTDFGWYNDGATIYEVVWLDSDHVEFHTPSGSLPLTRVK